MPKDIEKLLIEGNFQFQNKIIQNPEKYSFDIKIPKYPLLFLTCMDPRIDVHRIFQLDPGDAFILRNAGNIYTLDIMRSILITIYKYNIKYIIVLGHMDCGMTKININELKQRFSNEFLKQLSADDSDLLSKLHDFFKPIDNEIRNIIRQINDLQEIKTFFPNVEITGMLYDTQTGWIFKQEDFRDLLIKDNHFKIYKRLLFEKNQKLSEYLKINTPNLTLNEIAGESELKEENESIEISETNIRDDELQKPDHSKYMSKIFKIQVPKIYIPKLKIHIPKNTRVKLKK